MSDIPSLAPSQSWLLPAIHPSYARIICSYLKNRGYAIEDLLAGNTLSWPTLIEQQRFISFHQFRGIVLNALKLTSSPWLGVDIAKLLPVSVHGSLGYGAVAAPTVKDAFKLIEQALVTRISMLNFNYQEVEAGARFTIDESFDLAELKQVIYPLLVGAFCDIVEKTTGDKAFGVKVGLPYAKPLWFSHYNEQFPDFTFEFGVASFYVDIPLALLNVHSLTADEFAYRNAERECLSLIELRQQGGELSEQIKRYLFSCDSSYPKQTEVCQKFGVSVRTLIRKLKIENTSYQAILDEVRTELSCWKLQNTELSVERVAESVGFIDTSNFARVFKKWMGCKPSDYRKQSGSGLIN